MINECEILPRNGGDNVIEALFEELHVKELIPNYDFDSHLDAVYELDEKEKF